MTKAEMIKTVSYESGLSQEKVKLVLNALANTVVNGLKNDEEVPAIDGFKFAPKVTAERTCRNPQTGESIAVPEKKSVKLKIGKYVKEALND